MMTKETQLRFQKAMNDTIQKYGADTALGGETADQALDRLAESGDAALNYAYGRLVTEPTLKSQQHVAKAADRLDDYVRAQLLKGESLVAGHDRLAAGGDARYAELYKRCSAHR